MDVQAAVTHLDVQLMVCAHQGVLVEVIAADDVRRLLAVLVPAAFSSDDTTTRQRLVHKHSLTHLLTHSLIFIYSDRIHLNILSHNYTHTII